MSLLWKKKNHLCFCITNATWKLLHICRVNVLYIFLFSGLAEYFEKYLNSMNNTGIFYSRLLAGQCDFDNDFMTREGTFFSYLEVANCCVKQCLNKKISNLFILFSAFLETSIAYTMSISGSYSLFNNFQEWKLLYSCEVVYLHPSYEYQDILYNWK